MNKLILVAMILAAALSEARNTGTRGGGDAVICKNGNTVSSVEVLDYFEATQMGLTLDLGPESLSYTEKIQLVLDRWEKLDPMLVLFFKQEILRFEEHAAFIDRSYLTELDDSNEMISPKSNCSIRQMAIFRMSDLAPGEKRFLVDKELWNLMNNTQKAGLVIHELFWYFYKSHNRELKDSSAVRRLNAILSSTLLTNYTAFDYIRFVSQLWKTLDPYSIGYRARTGSHSPSVLLNGIIWSINESLAIEDGQVTKGFLPDPPPMTVGRNTYYFSGWTLLHDNTVELFKNGSVKEGHLFKPVEATLNSGVKLTLPALYPQLKFTEAGLLRKVESKNTVGGVIYIGVPFKASYLEWNGVKFPIEKVEFFEDEQVKSIDISISFVSKNFNFEWKGRRYQIKTEKPFDSLGDSKLEFNSTGDIVDMKGFFIVNPPSGPKTPEKKKKR